MMGMLVVVGVVVVWVAAAAATSVVSAAIVRLSAAIVGVGVLTLCHIDVAFNSIRAIGRCCFVWKDS